MSTQTENAPTTNALGRLWKLVLALVILALAGATVYLLAERNSRFYYLSTEGNRLVVERGARLPWGKQAWAPADPALAEVYAAIELPAGVAAIAEQRFDERQDLDRALFELLAGWADARVRTDEPAKMREGLVYVERAGKLPGIDSDQQRRLRALRAELAYYEGRDRLENGGRLLDEALRQFQLATEASPARAREAVAILDDLQPAVERLTRALQTARGLRAPVAPEAAAPAVEAAPRAAGEVLPIAVPLEGTQQAAEQPTALPAGPEKQDAVVQDEAAP
ncbi:hypothetical protein [Vulgatibacter sp.]|uniref:hypothetical protein n=1 Tax=Vulgatibacter sp. TaxID=1971226 RepID=UPI00356196F2